MMARGEVEAKAKGLFVTFLLTSLHIWNSSGTLVGFSYDAKQGSPMSWSPKETLLSFLQKHKLSSSQLRVFLSNPDAFSNSLSTTQINSIQSKPSAISWIEDCIVKHLPHLNITTIVVDTTKQDLTSILLTLNSIHSVLEHFDLDGRIKVSLMFSLTDLDMNLTSMMEFVMLTKSSIFVEAFVDRELSLGDGFIHSVLQRAIYACSLLLSYPEIPLVLNIKSLVVPGGVEMVRFSEKVMKSIDSHPLLKDRISAIFVEISPLAESEQKKITWQEEVIFPTSHRQLLDKKSVTIHDTVSPVTVPSTNPSLDIVTVPSTTTPTTNLPITSPITVPSTNPTTTPIIFPSTNLTTTPIMVPATNPVTNPATNPTAPPVTNPTAAPVTVPPAVPVTNPVTTPTTNPVNQPVTNPTTYPLVPPATGTPNTVPVTPAMGTPATGTPSTVPVTPATESPSTVPVTPAMGTPATGTPNTVPVAPATGTPATGTPSTLPVTPATGTPSTVPVTPATGTTATGTPNTVPVSPATGTPTGSGQSWCVAKSNVTEDALQDALDYACGIGGADCSAIQMSGSCYNPNSLQSHASYAFNSYYQKNPVPTSCDFGEAAMLVTTNPSTGACVFSSSSSSASSVNPGLNPTSGSNTGIGSTGTGNGPSGVAPTYGSSSGSGSSVLNSSTGSNTVFGSDSPTGIVSGSSFCRPGGWILFGLVIAANLQLLQ